jgi:hypothetical protein
VLGTIALGETVTLLVKHGNLPKRAKLEALIKRTQTGPFKPLPLIATGTVAKQKLEIDRPKLELYIRAKLGKKILAQLGSELDPIILSTTPPPPPLAQAWSEPPPPLSRTATVSTSTTARLTETAPPPPPPAVAGGGLSGLEIGLIAGGAGLIVVGVAIAVIVVATKQSNCEVEEGFGCVEVQVLPLVRF